MENLMLTLGVGFFAAMATLAADAGTSPYVQFPILGATGAISLFAVWRIYRSIIAPLARRVEDQEDEIRGERRRRMIAEWRFDKLVLYLRDHEGIAVPDDIRSGIPPWIEEAT